MRVANTGCPSVTFAPMMKIARASSAISAIELVIAPEPKAIVNPATVGAWHRRAQFSTLCVPTTCRASFWTR